jgi:hypothetical protein
MEPSGRNRRQPVAKPTRPDTGSNTPFRNGRQPRATARDRMVRRGSTVRVRQRALQKPRMTGLLVSDRVADSRTWGRYGALYGAFRSKTRSKQPRRMAAEYFPDPSRDVVVAWSAGSAARFGGILRTGSAFTDAKWSVGSDRAGRRARDNWRRRHSLAPPFDFRSL